MATQEQCQVLDQTQVGPRYFKLTLKSLYISTNAEPGQFVNVRVDSGTEPLLRRPISLHKINREDQTFELLYEVLGQGTELLSKVIIGSKLDVLGPLGSGFKFDPEKKIIGYIEIQIHVPSEFPEKYESAVIHTASLCAVKRHLREDIELLVKVVRH